MNVRRDNFTTATGWLLHTALFLPLLMTTFLFSLSRPAQTQNQALTDEQKKKLYEKRFGNNEDQARTAAQAVKFAKNVIKLVQRRNRFSKFRYYAHDRVRNLLSNYESNPDALQQLIKINIREQRQLGFSYSRNERIIELLGKKVQAIRNNKDRLKLLHRIIGTHRSAAQHALVEKNWDKARTEYERITQISNNVDGIDQTPSAKT